VYLDEVWAVLAEFVETVEDLLLDEGLMQLVDLPTRPSTLITCFLEIFLMAKRSPPLVPSNTSPKEPSPSLWPT
jgi:hypothetical protein